jgi:hypothetical protein
MVAEASLSPIGCERDRANSGSGEPAFRILTTDAGSGCDMLLSSALHSSFFGAAHVMDSSGYHLASALIGRGVGRMTPRS